MAFRLTEVIPAWLVSLLVHVVGLVALGLLGLSAEDETVLSSRWRWSDAQEDLSWFEETDPAEPELSGAADIQPIDVTADNTDFTRVDLVTESDLLGRQPDLFSEIADSTLRPVNSGSMFTGRSGENRDRLVAAEGGTADSEAAVARGLGWMARHQAAEGYWSFDEFHRVPACDGACRNPGNTRGNRTGATALALLPFLGAGQTHTTGDYRQTVDRGLRWLLSAQAPDGDLRGAGNGRMYAHAQAAIVLCEAYAMTGDTLLKTPAQRALDFIIDAQDRGGGWRYYPRQKGGDTSVIGWQIMALRSGQMGGLKVPKETLDGAARYLDRAQTDTRGGLYAYRPGRRAIASMTAEGLLCRQYLGWPGDHPGLLAGCRFLLSRDLPGKSDVNIYYWYYATQVMHHMGGDTWDRWNNALRDRLIAMQASSGHETGSWSPKGGRSFIGGRLYMTSLAVCTLEVYYRHMPLYRSPLEY